MAITAQNIIDGVKRRVTFPSSQVLIQDSDILAFANEIIQSEMIPILESLNQDFFVERTTFPIVGGVTEYPIPYRAIGRSLRELKILDSNNYYRNCALISIENAYLYQQFVQVTGFYFRSDKIHLVPDVPANTQPGLFLVVWYRLPPSKLVQEQFVSQITSIVSPSFMGPLFTDVFVTYPENITTTVDFVQAVSGNSIYGMDVPVIAKTGSRLTFNVADIPVDLAPNDYVCPPQTSTVVNFLPNECYPLIVSLTAKRCLKADGDFDGVKMLEDDITEERKNIKLILEPRIEGESTIILNPFSIARIGKQSQRSWLYGQ